MPFCQLFSVLQHYGVFFISLIAFPCVLLNFFVMTCFDSFPFFFCNSSIGILFCGCHRVYIKHLIMIYIKLTTQFQLHIKTVYFYFSLPHFVIHKLYILYCVSIFVAVGFLYILSSVLELKLIYIPLLPIITVSHYSIFVYIFAITWKPYTFIHFCVTV